MSRSTAATPTVERTSITIGAAAVPMMTASSGGEIEGRVPSIWSSCASLLLLKFSDLEPIEIGHTVGLDPKPDAPICGTRLWRRIFCHVQRLVVEEDGEP